MIKELKKALLAIQESGCICGMHSHEDDGADFYISKSKHPNFGHLEDCHKVISARVLGWKVVKK